jgi:hypothetical protein
MLSPPANFFVLFSSTCPAVLVGSTNHVITLQQTFLNQADWHSWEHFCVVLEGAQFLSL